MVMSKVLSGGTPFGVNTGAVAVSGAKAGAVAFDGAKAGAEADDGAKAGAEVDDGALLGMGAHEPHAYPLADLNRGIVAQDSAQSTVPSLPIFITYPDPLHRSASLFVLHGRPSSSNNVAKKPS